MDRVSPERPGLEDRTFLLLIVILSLGFAAILLPVAGAILWALVIATVFRPLCQRLASAMQQRPTLAAVSTLVIIVITVILPLSLIAGALVQEPIMDIEAPLELMARAGLLTTTRCSSVTVRIPRVREVLARLP